MRAPFLQLGGDEQFQMLMDANMTYDSSISIFDNSPPYWPYTLDFGIQHDCMITPCPTRSYPGKCKLKMETTLKISMIIIICYV